MLAEQPQGHATTPIIDALPFCYGSNTWKQGLVPSLHLPCDCCLLDSATCLLIHREYRRELDGECLRALLRVYARENHELHARVDALEWLREVDAYDLWTQHPKCTACGLSSYNGRIFAHALDELQIIWAHARKEAGV